MTTAQESIKLALQRLDGDTPFHTIQEVAENANLPYATVRATVLQSDEFVVSSRTTESGEPLVSTREEFREKASFGRKLLGAFASRID